MGIPEYIEERIRRPVPGESCIVPSSTPVVSFGDAQTAKVATLGLNPSRAEFLDKNGTLLDGPKRRLATHISLGTQELARASPRVVLQALEDCNAYFHRQPYWNWFDQLSPILAASGASYRDGSACHLDLVQWATDPTWGRLPSAALRNRLIAADAPFLANQLRGESLRLLLVNGRGVLQQLCKSMANVIELREVQRIEGFARVSTALFAGQIFGRIRVVAWSTNLQSAHGVTNALRTEIASRVQTLIQ